MSGGAVVITGARSPIARAVAARFARAGHALVLAGRDRDEVERLAADLRLRHGVPVTCVPFDAAELDGHGRFWDDCVGAAEGRVDGVVLCHGFMAEQADAQRDVELARRMIDVNYASAVSVLERAAAHFETRPGGGGRGGFLCALSSVAGDRGRRSNYLYGSTKAALSVYLQGLRHRMAARGVTVTDVRPGFVDTAMTWGRPGTFLVASPARVAADLYNAARTGRAVIYTPCFWRGIMFAIRSVPNAVMHRTKL